MDTLPASLERAIEKVTSTLSTAALSKASQSLSKKYRNGETRLHHEERLAYLVTRFPATFASLTGVFCSILQLYPYSITSLLDIGAGPGTGMWAAGPLFPSLETATCYERDLEWIALGQQLARDASSPLLLQAHWQRVDVRKKGAFPPHALVLFSYSWGELEEADRRDTLQKGWQAATQLLVLVEPGTPQGFRSLSMAREWLRAQGAHLLAPCPHQGLCPLNMSEEKWCHFSRRTGRSFRHRLAKGASLPFEDVAYSYLVATKQPTATARSRLLHQPVKHKGHVVLTLCHDEKVLCETISKREKERYSQAKKAHWGDAWDLPKTPHFDSQNEKNAQRQ